MKVVKMDFAMVSLMVEMKASFAAALWAVPMVAYWAVSMAFLRAAMMVESME